MFDKDQYERIVKQYSSALYNYCYIRLYKDKFLTEETLNDVFAVLYNKWEKLEVGENIGAYLYRVADMCIKKARRERQKYISHNESIETAFVESKLEFGVYDDAFEEHEIDEGKYIDQIKQALPREYRSLFEYRFVEKCTLEELVRRLDIPYSTLRYRLLKVENAVREEINKIFKK